MLAEIAASLRLNAGRLDKSAAFAAKNVPSNNDVTAVARSSL